MLRCTDPGVLTCSLFHLHIQDLVNDTSLAPVVAHMIERLDYFGKNGALRMAQARTCAAISTPIVS